MTDANGVSSSAPPHWPELLSDKIHWKLRANAVELHLRRLLLALAEGDVLDTRELVARLYPVGGTDDDYGVRHELIHRVLKCAQKIPGLAVSIPVVSESGFNKGKTVNRYYWRRIDPAAMPAPRAPDIAPEGDPELTIIRAHLAEQRTRLDHLEVAIQALATKVGLT